MILPDKYLTAIERHWLNLDREQTRALSLYESMLTADDLVRLWAYRIATNPNADQR